MLVPYRCNSSYIGCLPISKPTLYEGPRYHWLSQTTLDALITTVYTSPRINWSKPIHASVTNGLLWSRNQGWFKLWEHRLSTCLLLHQIVHLTRVALMLCYNHNHHFFFHTERSNNIFVLCIFYTAHSNDSDRQKVLLLDSDVIPSRGQDKILAHLVYFQDSLWICSEEVPGDLQRRPIGGRGIAINQILSMILPELECPWNHTYLEFFTVRPSVNLML